MAGGWEETWPRPWQRTRVEPRGHMLTSSHMVTLLLLVNMVKYSHDGSVASQNSVYSARPDPDNQKQWTTRWESVYLAAGCSGAASVCWRAQEEDWMTVAPWLSCCCWPRHDTFHGQHTGIFVWIFSDRLWSWSWRDAMLHLHWKIILFIDNACFKQFVIFLLRFT